MTNTLHHVILMLIFSVLAINAVILRLYARRMRGRKLEANDCLIMLGLVSIPTHAKTEPNFSEQEQIFALGEVGLNIYGTRYLAHNVEVEGNLFTSIFQVVAFQPNGKRIQTSRQSVLLWHYG